jgi:hypothetical protein
MAPHEKEETMNTATEILLMTEEGKRVPGGETDTRTRGGIFGPQGYGGGVFDGSSAFGAIDPGLELKACQADCVANNPPGSPGLAPCLQKCDATYGLDKTATKSASENLLWGVGVGGAAGLVVGLAVGYGRGNAPSGAAVGAVSGLLFSAIGIAVYRNRTGA